MTTPRSAATAADWDTIIRAPGVRQTREDYRAEVRRVRTAPSSAGEAYRVDKLNTRLSDDPAWEARQAGFEQEAFDRLNDDLPMLRAELRARQLAGVHLRRLVLAPTVMSPYNEFALEAARWLADLGEDVRVLIDDQVRARVPEITVYGDTTWRLCTTADEIADGAVRLEDPDQTAQARQLLSPLWDQALPIQDLDHTSFWPSAPTT